MYHDLPRDASFWQFLFSVDKDLARTTKSQGCACGGRLHGAKYPRKPRGAGNLPEDYNTRLSFCCDRDGCRKRTTPPSVRLPRPEGLPGGHRHSGGRHAQGPSPRRVRALTELFGTDRRTIARWQVFWREHFPQTPFWKAARGRFVRLVLADLPRALLEAFAQQAADAREQWKPLLEFLSPITIPGALLIKGLS